MTLHETLKEEIKNAMRAKDAPRLEVLRGIVTSFVNELVAKKKTPQEILDDESAMTVIKRLLKQRKDSMEQFTAGGRPDLAEKERRESEIIGTFLPQMMSREEIRKIAEAKKIEMGVTDKSKIGQFIGAVMKACAGKADGTDVKSVVEELLA
jgi:uncharacterized protein YqeY